MFLTFSLCDQLITKQLIDLYVQESKFKRKKPANAKKNSAVLHKTKKYSRKSIPSIKRRKHPFQKLQLENDTKKK